jgi:RND family efflux transporter MFP subunit
MRNIVKKLSLSLIYMATAAVTLSLSLTACDKPAGDSSASKDSKDSKDNKGSAASKDNKDNKDNKNGSGAKDKKTEPISITTVIAQTRELPSFIKATGTVVSLNSVEVRAQASSVIKQVHFKEGQFVKAGDLLFTLDARLDEANLAKAQAQLLKDQASAADLSRQLARNQQLLAQNFISNSALNSSQAALEAQTAVIAADQAAIKAANVPLSYAKIVAPSSGRAGAVAVFAGSFVQAGLTPLVTITQLDPIAVSFNVAQSHVPTLLKALQTQATVSIKPPESERSISGTVQFVDSSVDASSGTVKVKARVNNAGNAHAALWPGAFVDVQLPFINTDNNTAAEAVVIPQACIIQAPRGTMVYVVLDGKAVSKNVELISASQGFASVKGLSVGDVVVLDGRQNLRPDAPVIDRGKALPAPLEKATEGAAQGHHKHHP